MIQITEEQVYDFPATSAAIIICNNCNKPFTRKINSIRNNIKKNSVYKCHKCVTSSHEYIDKQRKSHPKTGHKWSKKIEVECDKCGTIYEVNYRSHKWCEKHNKPHHCSKCSHKLAHKNGKYKSIYTDGFKSKLVENGKKFWDNISGDEWKSVWMHHLLNDDDYIEFMRECGRKPWKDPEYREKMAVVRANQPRISSIQVMLYNLLDGLDIKYYKESDKTVIGYYAFDCLVPNKSKSILIECQGDYWHSIPNVQSRDKAKFTYINKYFPEYEIMYLWEHEFYTDGRVLDRLKLKLGIDVETVNYSFDDVTIVDDVPTDEVRSFLNSYHYIGRGRGGRTIGAMYRDKLIAIAVFSPPLRQNHGGFHGEFVELSRFCIHPSYHKKNFGSWLLSKSIKAVGSPKIVAYADSTVGHVGTIYKASNFKLSHEVKPDYWYVDNDGYVMHKRTLYGRASKMGMTESSFASEFKYDKKYGGPKYCFVKE